MKYCLFVTFYFVISNGFFYFPTIRKMTKPLYQKGFQNYGALSGIVRLNSDDEFRSRKSFKNSDDEFRSLDSYENNRYPFSKRYYERALRRLNSQNNTVRDNMILGKDEIGEDNEEDDIYDDEDDDIEIYDSLIKNKTVSKNTLKGIQIFITGNDLSKLGFLEDEDDDDEDEETIESNDDKRRALRKRDYEESYGKSSSSSSRDKKSENFEVMTHSGVCFADIGGYDSIKKELGQCIDILKNIKKYEKFNVRVPKGLIFEGPPGNGKTLIAKALATEAKTNFIPVSGAEFQEKYVGVGASRVRELFQLAKKNKPCIIFIDEIDALGRKRSSEGDQSSSERDSTLNELLVNLDGFKNLSGVFLVGATNRIDLLDSALIRPGRIDKKVYIGLPDAKTREAILDIHIQGKPHDDTVVVKDLIEQTNGFSGAQIENLLNEAMLLSLRDNREIFTGNDFETVLNKMMVGWQANDHEFSKELVRQIAVHEMGHVIMGLVSKHHANITKVVINLSSPNSPGYTVFETKNSNIYTREYLFEHLKILLAGRIAEELVYGESITTGAVNDFEEALKLAEKMVVFYGMGDNVIYSSKSDSYKEVIDEQVTQLIDKAYDEAYIIVNKSKNFIMRGAEILQEKKIIRAEELKVLLVG